MSTSEAIQPVHLSRLAIVYVRQSSPHQALANQESLELQYNLQHRAHAAGWQPSQIRVIDTDLGRTGRTKAGRPGFQELVTLVNQEQVGIVFAYDVTRLARNCTDWYQLLDLCGWRCCLVADQDGIYDPATPNGRLILGLKGLISELELHTLRARLTAGLLNKAQRGELALALPIGFVRDRLGRVLKRPDEEVQSRLALSVTVGSLARLSFADDMEREILERAKEGQRDEEIARGLTKKGYRSTKHDTVLVSTVRFVRLRHRLFRKRSQSHPRHIPGYLTIPELANRLGSKLGWLYHLIHNGTIEIARDLETNLYLFPDQPNTIAHFEQLRAGQLKKLRF